MSEDFEPARATPQGPLMIDGYRPGGFTIGGRRHDGPVVVLEASVLAWSPGEVPALTLDDFAGVLEAEPRPEILILGSGPGFVMASAALRAQLREHGIALECMASAAACRTYNLLRAEDRRVAAALLPAG
ncbi:MAG: Mth938-like domain-containing protein [Geminicoccaceae bacterium]|nr:Mth938-like domain-containing protein [Geminicoccaceae bacterium]